MPFGDGDPWAAIRAAVHRTTPGGAALGIDECVSARTALTMFLGRPDQPTHPRTLEPGQPADLCVLSVPPETALAELEEGWWPQPSSAGRWSTRQGESRDFADEIALQGRCDGVDQSVDIHGLDRLDAHHVTHDAHADHL